MNTVVLILLPSGVCAFVSLSNQYKMLFFIEVNMFRVI